MIFHTKQKYFSLPILAAVLTLFHLIAAPSSAAIIIGGTGNALGTMKQIAKAYKKTNPGIKVKVLPSIGSSGAIKAVPAGRVQIGLSARPLEEAESKKGLIAIEYAQTPTIFVVSNKTNVYAITISQLVDIYKGVLRKWPNDDSTIRPILRQANEDNTKQLKALSPELKKAVDLAETKKTFIFTTTDQETVDTIEKTPGSFGVTSLALLLSEKRNLRALTLDGVKPSVQSSISGDYPMSKRFYFILPIERSPQVNAFLDFVFSKEGVALAKQYGCYPVQ